MNTTQNKIGLHTSVLHNIQEVRHRNRGKLALTTTQGGMWTWRYNNSMESKRTNREVL